MKLQLVIGTVMMAGLASTPAFALYCSNGGPPAPTITVDRPDGTTETRVDTKAQQEMDLQRLRAAGVDARSVERWAGCLRAFMTAPDGSQSMEFYDPGTLQRVQ
jgi:hypothetical protein